MYPYRDEEDEAGDQEGKAGDDADDVSGFPRPPKKKQCGDREEDPAGEIKAPDRARGHLGPQAQEDLAPISSSASTVASSVSRIEAWRFL